MKTLTAVCVLAGVALASAALHAQEEFIAPTVPRDIPVRPLPATPDSQPSVEGIVAEIFRNPLQSWQLINPLAPREYGDGRKTVSWDPTDPGKPKGFIVLALDY